MAKDTKKEADPAVALQVGDQVVRTEAGTFLAASTSYAVVAIAAGAVTLRNAAGVAIHNVPLAAVQKQG